jgi:hypothetical protein
MLSGLRGVHGLKCGLIYVWGENFETKNSNSIVGGTVGGGTGVLRIAVQTGGRKKRNFCEVCQRAWMYRCDVTEK